MKTFRELISWELEQDKRDARRLQITSEDSAGKIGSSVLSKLRYLSETARAANGQAPTIKPV